ncbi:MAG: hypothetical protein JST89_09400 [Cyanobacteria bacterium SZAS-4]|nr:hypothetical protein [Cyanobacteria bacterium SZAS-4]
MSRKCRLIPDIHEKVLALISRVNEIHTLGTGALILSELLNAFGVVLTNAEIDTLKQRDLVLLKKTSETGGTFENVGPLAVVKHSSVTISVPGRISGTYLSFPGSCSFVFADDTTISGSAFVFRVKLQEIDANLYKVDVDLSGDAFDQCIIHAAA